MFRSFSLPIKGQTWTAKRPVLVGILNTTPDSFFSASRVASADAAEAHAETLLNEGADWLDIGGCSTRPGAEIPSQEEEWQRVEPALQRIAKRFPSVPISIDTFRGEIAHRALLAGADIINDVSGGSLDPTIWTVASQSKAPYILTHYPAGHRPSTMQEAALTPEEVMQDMRHYFKRHLNELKRQGVEHVLLDPGLGFGKTLEANYRVLKELQQLQPLDAPLYIGLSRKSMLWKHLDRTPETVLPATSALHLYALEQGAQLLRVHDALEARDVLKIWETLHRL
jgi:dihydropteroate synthase